MNINTINQTGNHGKILEELRGDKQLPFLNVLSPEAIERHAEATPTRNRIFTPEVTLFLFLSQVINADSSCQAAVLRAIAHFEGRGEPAPSPNTSAYVQARQRLQEVMITGLARECAEELEENADPEWLWRNRHIKLIDGSTISMPDTVENQTAFPQTDTQKEGIGFPLARVVAVISLATGAVLEFAMGAYAGKETGEHALLRQVMSAFNKGDIVLGDRYYASFFLIAAFIGMGVDVVFQSHRARKIDFRRGTKLGKKDHLIAWKKPARPEWMDEATWKKFPAEIIVRETTIYINNPGFRQKSYVIVSTFTDGRDVTRVNLAELYRHRWYVEVTLASIKTTMGMDILNCKTPEMVRKEIWSYLLAYNLIRKIMAQAARVYNKKPSTISFKLAMQAISIFIVGCAFSTNNILSYQAMLKMIAYKKVGNRPDRNEPRMIKRRPKSFPKLQKARKFYQRAA